MKKQSWVRADTFLELGVEGLGVTCSIQSRAFQCAGGARWWAWSFMARDPTQNRKLTPHGGSEVMGLAVRGQGPDTKSKTHSTHWNARHCIKYLARFRQFSGTAVCHRRPATVRLPTSNGLTKKNSSAFSFYIGGIYWANSKHFTQNLCFYCTTYNIQMFSCRSRTHTPTPPTQTCFTNYGKASGWVEGSGSQGFSW